jgi:hypothetical protein
MGSDDDMALSVVVMGRGLTSPGRRVVSWGYWDVHDWDDPTNLAIDPDIVHPGTREVLVLAPQHGHDASVVSAGAIASQRPDIKVRVEQTPYSVGALTRALERVPETWASPTAVHAGLHQALRETTLGAWLPSVTKLSVPAPSMRQHVSSWFGGSGFLAVRGEPGWVAKLPVQRWEPGQRLTRPSGAGDLECRTDGELPEPAIAALFQMGLASRPQRVLPAGDAEVVWGTSRAVEFVIGPATPVELGQPSGTCQVCREPVWGMTCPFCRIVLPGGTSARFTPGGTR